MPRPLRRFATTLAACALFGSPLRGADIRHVQPPALHNNPRYTHVVVVDSGPLAFVSGQVALDGQGRLVGKGDMRAQARQVFENLKIALAAAGSDLAHVVRVNAYLADMNQIEAYRQVRQEYFGSLSAQPASTLVGVMRLAEPDLLLEVEAVAAVSAPGSMAEPVPPPNAPAAPTPPSPRPAP